MKALQLLASLTLLSLLCPILFGKCSDTLEGCGCIQAQNNIKGKKQTREWRQQHGDSTRCTTRCCTSANLCSGNSSSRWRSVGWRGGQAWPLTTPEKGRRRQHLKSHREFSPHSQSCRVGCSTMWFDSDILDGCQVMFPLATGPCSSSTATVLHVTTFKYCVLLSGSMGACSLRSGDSALMQQWKVHMGVSAFPRTLSHC